MKLIQTQKDKEILDIIKTAFEYYKTKVEIKIDTDTFASVTMPISDMHYFTLNRLDKALGSKMSVYGIEATKTRLKFDIEIEN